MKERMPSAAPQKPVDHWENDVLATAPPIEVLSHTKKKENERKRKEMVGRLAERVLRFTKSTPVVAALFAVNGLISSAQYSKHDLFDPAYGLPEGESAESFTAKREYVAGVLGEESLNQQVPTTSLDRDQARRGARREEYHASRPPAVEGFEEALGMRHETIEQLLSQGYPRGFGGEHAVERLRYTLERIPMPPSYGIHGYEAGHCTVSRGEGASEIVLTPDGIASQRAELQVRAAFGPLLSHELAHASDWQNVEAVSPEVRLHLLHQVLRRLESGEAIQYPYVQSIRNPQRDLQAERLSKAKEYFAELMSDAFDTPSRYFVPFEDPIEALAVALATRHDEQDVSRRLPDARIVVEYVRALDPSFDWRKAALSREKSLRQLTHERGRILLERSVGAIHSPALVEVLLDAIHTSRTEAFQEAPVMSLGDGSDEGADLENEERILQEFGERERQRFAVLRTRLREDWNDDVERAEMGFSAEHAGAFKAWSALVGNVYRTYTDTDFGQHYRHESVRELVSELNQHVDAFRDDPAALRSFESHAREYLSLRQGRILLTSDDLAAIRRYSKVLHSNERLERQRVASL